MCDSRYFNMFAHSGIQHIGLWFLLFVCLCLVSCAPGVAGFSGLSVLGCPVLPVSLDCPFLVAPSVSVKFSLFEQFIEKTLRQI